jgi:two-component system KDP operon response regulator KdpE
MSADQKLLTTALVVDDEPQIRRLLRITLEGNGYRVVDAVNGKEGLLEAAQSRPEVVLLDLGLPDMNGIEVLKRLREWSRVPVIILSVRDRESDKIAALDAGADDYVTKPFGSGELLARMRAALRNRPGQPEETIFSCATLEVDFASRAVRKSGRELKLTPLEYSLLRLFVKHAGKVLTHRQILLEVWGPNAGKETHFLRVHIAHLRDKIEENPSTPEWIITEPSIGYRFLLPESNR